VVRVRLAKGRELSLSLLSILSVSAGIQLYPMETIEDGETMDSKKRQ
jgi:hypothetical protein